MMIPIGKDQNYYYIDLVEIDKFVRLDTSELSLPREPINSENDDRGNSDKMYSIIKYDIVKAMIESILNEYPNQESEYIVSNYGKNASVPFAISFNTLRKYNLLKEI